MLAAADSRIIRFDSNGVQSADHGVQLSDGSLVTGWFTLSLDPGAKGFWSGNITNGWVYHFDLATGALLDSFQTSASPTRLLTGFCVVQEYTAAREPCNGVDDDENGTADDNCPPVAMDDTYATSEDTPLTVAAPGVAGNDSDPDGFDQDGDPLTRLVVTPPEHGTLTLDPDGSFTYTPEADFGGTDTFTYKVNEGAIDSNLATVTVTVNGVNDPPVADPDSYTAVEDTALDTSALGLPGVLANDDDPEDQSLTITGYTQPSHGSALVNPDGSFTYTPQANYFGPDNFTYTANDGHGGSDTATVTIDVAPVNDAPVAQSSTPSATEEIPAPGVLANDTDPDGDALAASLVSGPSHGTLTLNANGSFSYTPATGYSGPDSFVYQVNDGHNQTAQGTVTITMPANAPPVCSAAVANPATIWPVNHKWVKIVIRGVTDPNNDAVTIWPWWWRR